MSSFSLLPDKNRSRKPLVWQTETPKWGDAPSFSFDYYDHGARKDLESSSDLHDVEVKGKNGLKPVRRFIPDSWKRFFRKSKTEEECYTLDDVHNLPSISSLGDVSKESSLVNKSRDYRETSSINTDTVSDIKQKKTPNSIERKSQRATKPKRIVFQDEVQELGNVKGKVMKTIHFSDKGSDTGALSRSIPTGYRPKPYTVPDYVVKYPEIKSAEERENYKAVFNDQYTEYKELYSEVRLALQKFKELDTMMQKLTSGPQSQKASDRIKAITEKYEKKKNDPAFTEKQDRCIYLKGKLTHIKKQIQAYDQHEGSVYF
ncbi:occludin/ELL domain-containing protein 1 isoform 3-T3 [Leptodactylus fuscus]|uniref:occludin/ELL domain-containing protein 1 isoform X3 n=1 Tax=Leptodactylus fuscus TaxID=238119 RepID=UPI003F4E83DC